MNTFNQTSSNSNSKNIAGNQEQSVRMALLEGIKRAKTLMQSEKSENDASLNAPIKEFESRLNEGDSVVESDSAENQRDFSGDVDVSNSGKGIKQKNQEQQHT